MKIKTCPNSDCLKTDYERGWDDGFNSREGEFLKLRADEHEKVRKEMWEKLERCKKSILADMAYTGGVFGKSYIKFQRSSELHYGSYNRAIRDIFALLSPEKSESSKEKA